MKRRRDHRSPLCSGLLALALALAPAGGRAEETAHVPKPRLPVVYTDLDGTALNRMSELSELNRRAARRFLDAGGLLGVATGRLPESGRRHADRLGANLPRVFANGALVFEADGRLKTLKALRDAGLVAEVCEAIEAAGCGVVYVATADPKTGRSRVEEGRCRPSTPDPVVKIRGRHCSRHGELLSRLRARASGRYSVVESGAGEHLGVSVAALGVTKGAALQEIAADRGLSLRDFVFVGDSGNDVSAARAVLDAGGRCFAVSNAVASLRAACPRRTTRDHDAGALAEVLEGLLKLAGPPPSPGLRPLKEPSGSMLRPLSHDLSAPSAAPPAPRPAE